MSVLTSIPTGGFIGESHSGAAGIGVAAAVFPVGTKVTVKQDAASGVTPGFCTFIYHQFDGNNIATAAKYPVQMHSWHTTDLSTFHLTADQSDAILVGPGAVSLGVVTDAYYAFFQCGGPICNGNATALATTVLDGNFTTDGTCIDDGLMYMQADGVWGGLANTGGVVSPAFGFAISGKADTTSNLDAEWIYLLDKFPASL